MFIRLSAPISEQWPPLCHGGSTRVEPNEYLQHVRIAKAREAREFSLQSVNEIAWKIGYEDPGAFRKVFNRIVGPSPGEYRKRFGIAELQVRSLRSAGAFTGTNPTDEL